jgi:hypothetical protein
MLRVAGLQFLLSDRILPWHAREGSVCQGSVPGGGTTFSGTQHPPPGIVSLEQTHPDKQRKEKGERKKEKRSAKRGKPMKKGSLLKRPFPQCGF